MKPKKNKHEKKSCTLVRLASFPENNPNQIIETDSKGVIYYLNPAAKKIFPGLEKLGKKHPFLSNLNSVFSFFKKNRKKDLLRELQIGNDWFQQQIYYIKENQHIRIYGQRITRHKLYQTRTAKITQLYSVISKVNEAIVRTQDEQALFSELCKIVSIVGEFPLVWVGKVVGINVQPVAHFGPASDYLKTIKVQIKGKLSTGPTGTCIRKDKEIVNDNFGINPLTLPWRKPALKFKFRASAAFPLRLQNKPIGALTLYTHEPKPFDPEKIKLLRALCADISYALGSFQQEQLRNRAEEGLRESEKKLNKTQEIAHIGTWELNYGTGHPYWSDETFRIYGYKPQEFIPTNEDFNRIVHPDDRQIPESAYKESIRQNKNTYEPTFRIINQSTGETRILHEKCEHTRDAYGKVIRTIGMVQDITEQKYMEQALEETRDYLEKLLNYANAPIIVWDPQLKITKFNHAFQEMTNYKEEEVLGKNLEILFPEEDKIELLKKIRETMSGKHWDTVEIPIRQKSGGIRIALWNSANIYNENHSTISIIAQGQDITERKKAEEDLKIALSRYRLVIELTNQFGWTTSPSGDIIEDMPEWRKYTGQSFEDVKGDKWSSAVHPDDLPDVRIKWKKALEEKTQYEAEYRIRKSDGTYRYFLSRGLPIFEKDGSIREWIGTCIDITERKNLDQRKDEFITIASHELRTPVSAIKIVTQTLQELLRRNPKALKYLKKIEEEATIQRNLIDDLLDVSKIQAGKIEIRKEKFDLSKLVIEITEIMQQTTKLHRIILKDLIDKKTVFADRERIEQVLSNFLSNAIKFSPKGGKILIKLEKNKNNLVISVKDCGIGIPKENQKRIYKKFYRVYGSGNKQIPGLGMGLYISGQIIKMHDGKTWFTSKQDKGSTFFFSLPINAHEQTNNI